MNYDSVGSNKSGDVSEDPQNYSNSLDKEKMISKLQNKFMQLKKMKDQPKDRYVLLTNP